MIITEVGPLLRAEASRLTAWIFFEKKWRLLLFLATMLLITVGTFAWSGLLVRLSPRTVVSITVIVTSVISFSITTYSVSRRKQLLEWVRHNSIQSRAQALWIAVVSYGVSMLLAIAIFLPTWYLFSARGGLSFSEVLYTATVFFSLVTGVHLMTALGVFGVIMLRRWWWVGLVIYGVVLAVFSYTQPFSWIYTTGFIVLFLALAVLLYRFLSALSFERAGDAVIEETSPEFHRYMHIEWVIYLVVVSTVALLAPGVPQAIFLTMTIFAGIAMARRNASYGELLFHSVPYFLSAIVWIVIPYSNSSSITLLGFTLATLSAGWLMFSASKNKYFTVGSYFLWVTMVTLGIFRVL